MWGRLRLNGSVKQTLFAALTFTTYICNGICRSYVAFLFNYLDEPDSIIKLDNEQKSWLVSSIGFLGPLGCLFSGTMMDFYGRKFYLRMIFIPFVLSWLIVTLSKNYTILLIGMSLQGLAGGMSICVATYISEIATRDLRGSLLGVLSSMYNIGVILCNITMYNFTWNKSSLIFMAMAIIFFIFINFLPESPIWLHTKGKTDKSLKVLCSIRCTDQHQLQSEILDLQKCDTKTARITIRSIITGIRQAWRQFFIVAALLSITQHSGLSTMTAYSVMIYDRLQLPFESSIITIFYSFSAFAGSLCTPFIMHKFSRRKTLSVCTICMALCMTVVALYEEFIQYQWAKTNVWIVPVAFSTFGFIGNAGVFSMPFTICGEIFPNEVRGTMNGIFGSFAYLHWAFTLKIHPMVMFNFGIKTLVRTFAICSLITCMYANFILPETHGKTLNEVQELYFKKKEEKLKHEMTEA